MDRSHRVLSRMSKVLVDFNMVLRIKDRRYNDI